MPESRPYDPDTHGERRSPDGQLLMVLRHFEASVDEKVGAISHDVFALKQSITAWMEAHRHHEPPCPHLLSAVPENDIEAHRRAHEEDMKWARQLRELKWAVVKVVTAAGVIGFLAWVGALMWIGALRGPGA